MKTVAILTPTYNRACLLQNLYNSLCEQTLFDFKWYVIDDGSTDNTEEKIASFKCGKFDIEYINKVNGGKHTALNCGLEAIKEPLTFIVESDDHITCDAVETIVEDWKLYNSIDKVCGLCYYKFSKDLSVIGKDYNSKEPIIDTYFNVRIN